MDNMTDSHLTTAELKAQISILKRRIAVLEDRDNHPPSPCQLHILKHIQQHQDANEGMSPTYDELAAIAGVKKVTVYEHVQALVSKGWLSVDPRRARSTVLTSKAIELLG